MWLRGSRGATYILSTSLGCELCTAKRVDCLYPLSAAYILSTSLTKSRVAGSSPPAAHSLRVRVRVRVRVGLGLRVRVRVRISVLPG